jgi:pyruvate/2-oxoglutarate dehydrogenase complex dihydrolipoamide dehydrogenase (E3) component
VLEGEGIRVLTSARNLRLSAEENGLRLALEDGAGAVTLQGSHLLLAVGRRPNTDDLGLECAGVTVNSRGYIEVDDQLRTSMPGIWALGDCNGRGAFTHTAYNDFEIVAANLLGEGTRSTKDRIPAYALYIDPPLGRAGMTEKQARDAGRHVLVGKMPMADVARAIEKGETAGLMKIVVGADNKEILGAAIFGTGGDEAIHCVLDLMYAKSPYTVLQRAMHIHPTVSELLPTIAGELTPA